MLTNRDLFDLERLPASMIVLGAGPIGTEMSQAFARLGTQVTVVDQGHQILPKEDRDLADALQRVLESEGVRFQLGCAIEEVRDLGSAREVRVRTAEGEDAAARRPRPSWWPSAAAPTPAGWAWTRSGLRTTAAASRWTPACARAVKHIFAAGDVTGGPQFTHAAGYTGGIVVSNAVFHLPRKADFTWLPWCTYTDPPLASIGMNEAAAKAAGVDYTVWTEEFQRQRPQPGRGREAPARSRCS